MGIAFDGEINAANEILTINTVAVGNAVWTGDTVIEILDESTGVYETVAVNTQFVLTVKDTGDNLVPFELTAGIPTVNLKTLTPTASDEAVFTATLEMRAQMPSYDSVTAICPYSTPVVGEYLPALDVFDCLHTNPAYDRPAITMFDAGFFYELPAFTLLDHDANMVALVGGVQSTVDQIYVWSDFLYNDWTPRITGINDDHVQIKNSLAILTGINDDHVQIKNSLAILNSKVDLCTLPNLPDQQVLDRLDSLEEGVDKIPEFNLLMFGLEDFMQDEELKGYVDAVIAFSPLYQKLDALIGTLNQVNEKTDANTQGISDTLAQCQQNAQTLTELSSHVEQHADNIASLTSQLQEANEIIFDQSVAMASMYTEEEVDQAIAIACPGYAEIPGGGNNPL